MKIRIASSLALAAALALGATGCSLVAPLGTTVPYAPSDGVNVDIDNVDVRNLMLVGAEGSENFNVVFSSINRSDAPVNLTITFVGEGSDQSEAKFEVPAGSAKFGDPEGEETPVVVPIPDAALGSTVEAYLQIPGANDARIFVPVIGDDLEEYSDYVIDESVQEGEKSDSQDSADESTKPSEEPSKSTEKSESTEEPEAPADETEAQN